MRIGYDHLTDELLNNEIIKLLLNYTNLGIIICDKFGVIQAVNDYSSNVLGFKVDEIVHQKLDKILSVSISDENETNYNLEDLLLKTSAPFSKAILMDGRTKGGETIKLKTHIDTMILEGEFSLLCFFENDQESKDLSQFTKKFNATFCQNEGGDEKFDCQVMKNLMQANTELSNEIDISHNLNTNFEEALLIEKKHSEFTTRFVSIASHEFRTPLSGILTSASLLEKYNEQGYEEQRLRHIKIIKGQVRNLIGILNDFLTFDSLDRPEVSVKIKMFCIKDFFYDYLHSEALPVLNTFQL